MAATDSVWAVEFINTDGDDVYLYFESPDSLGNYVRVNAEDANSFRIIQTTKNNMARLPVSERFEECEFVTDRG